VRLGRNAPGFWECMAFAAFGKAGVKDGTHKRAHPPPDLSAVYHPETGRIAKLEATLADPCPPTLGHESP